MIELPSPEYINQLARDAGALALHYFKQADPQTSLKSDNSVVTAADGAAERLIIEHLKRDWPQFAILGEEGGYEPPNEGAAGSESNWGETPIWVIDPIDGTANFADRLPYWCVSIGLMVGGKPVRGTIYAPVSGELYEVAPTPAGDLVPRWNGKPVHTAASASEGGAEGVATSRARRTLFLTSNQHKHLKLSWPGRTLCLGAVALDISLMARGGGRAVICRPQLWDVAASGAILSAAGGVVEPLTYAKGESGPVDWTKEFATPTERAKRYLIFAESSETAAEVRDTTHDLWHEMRTDENDE